ncbi:MAG TPA: prolyl oligopeptidase family serine peptidase [Candidatus Dormibacteraeota bacterium]|nr:prolyl oligopeptidase family serine peptidase [Candidatus Dormibacteraeota bacterium]
MLRFRRLIVACLGAVVVMGVSAVPASAAPTTHTGAFADGATFLIEVPSPWNGSLLLYSHGYVPPSSANPARDVGDPGTRAFLLSQGFALAGSSYATTGWALEDAFKDQIATLDTFAALVGKPKRTIAWGHSLGGIITAGLLQKFPDRFSAALPMCGVLAGGVAVWNEGLDGEFVIKTLLAPRSSLQLVHITTGVANLNLSEAILAEAQKTAQGRARIALAAAVGDLPGWFNPASPEPGATDFAVQEQNQFLWLTQVDGPFVFLLRGELEARAGGNPSWNTGVNYEEQLARSIDRAEVRSLYQQAGLNLDADLDALNNATRIKADPSAVKYLVKNVVFNGNLSGKPVLTIHTTGDGLVLNSDEQAYRSVVRDADNGSLLRQAFVHRAGHCTFTPAETVAAVQALVKRLNTGRWDSVATPSSLEAAAAALGPLNIVPPAYVAFQPAPFLRPFDLREDD